MPLKSQGYCGVVTGLSGLHWVWSNPNPNPNLLGIGRAPVVAHSARILDWQFEDTRGTFQPYVIPLLPQMGMLLFSPNDKVTYQMLQMGYDPSKGLGKQHTGIIKPISPAPRKFRTGLWSKFLMEAIVFTANPITWKSQNPVSVEQWPLTKEKLLAAKTLIFEQLDWDISSPPIAPGIFLFLLLRKGW